METRHSAQLGKEMNALGMLTGYELWLYATYIDRPYMEWRMSWDLTEEEDYQMGYAS
jgi:hypothetical protein